MQLSSGLVLVAGGNRQTRALLFDPTGGTLYNAGSTASARNEHTATLLLDGTVLLAGGQDRDESILETAEVFELTQVPQ